MVDAAVTIPAAVQERFDGANSYARGAVIPRNALRRDRLHRVDVRASKDIALPRGLKVTAIAQAFNLFNHRNPGAYNGLVGSATFAEPRQNLLSTYQPRVGQIAFKVSF